MEPNRSSLIGRTGSVDWFSWLGDEVAWVQSKINRMEICGQQTLLKRFQQNPLFENKFAFKTSPNAAMSLGILVRFQNCSAMMMKLAGNSKLFRLLNFVW